MAGAVAAVTIVIALFFAPRGYQAGFVDMAHDGYQLRQVLDLSGGGVIFRDTFDQYGPLSGYLNAAGFLALGRRLLAVKYFICGVYGLIAAALFVVARHWLNPVLAAFTVLVWIGLAPFYQHGIMISPHVYVLLFQTLATLVALRSPGLEPARLAAVGALAGLSWAAKQTIGTLFFAAILAYLGYRLVSDGRGMWRRSALAAVAVSGGYLIVVCVVLAWLWSQGALADWYRQTIAFPRDFYLLEYGRQLQSGSAGLSNWSAVVSVTKEFIRLQTAQAPYWLVIRVAVFAGAVAAILRRRDDGLVLMASITACLWLAAFPSANFMHQWWTASLAFPPFVFVVQRFAGRMATTEAIASAGAIALVLVLVGWGIVERKRAASFRANALNQTIADPPMLRGIRTDRPMKTAIEALYAAMARYVDHHPGTKVVAIDSADGVWSGINESLLFLSAFDGNTHPLPVYWSMPVLSTTTYPRYAEALSRQIHHEHPLLVEHHTGRYSPRHVAGYALLAAVESDFGFWYAYVPEHADRAGHGELSFFLMRDGSTDTGFAENGRPPADDPGMNPTAAGASRGTMSRAGVDVGVYTWPADVPLRSIEARTEPVADPVLHADIARRDAHGGWIVDGQAKGRFDYLLRFAEQEIARGATLLVRGDVAEGGFQVGLVDRDHWSSFVTVTTAGPFEVMIANQKAGRYRLEVANCIETTAWQAVRRHWLRGTLGVLTGGYMPNRFTISEFGWVRRE